jgi:hypothetical protein
MSTQDDGTGTARAQIKEFFMAQRGYWRPWTVTMLHACPGFVQQYAHYAGYPARTGPLTERMVELIYVALDSSSSRVMMLMLVRANIRFISYGEVSRDSPAAPRTPRSA